MSSTTLLTTSTTKPKTKTTTTTISIAAIPMATVPIITVQSPSPSPEPRPPPPPRAFALWKAEAGTQNDGKFLAPPSPSPMRSSCRLRRSLSESSSSFGGRVNNRRGRTAQFVHLPLRKHFDTFVSLSASPPLRPLRPIRAPSTALAPGRSGGISANDDSNSNNNNNTKETPKISTVTNTTTTSSTTTHTISKSNPTPISLLKALQNRYRSTTSISSFTRSSYTRYITLLPRTVIGLGTCWLSHLFASVICSTHCLLSDLLDLASAVAHQASILFILCLVGALFAIGALEVAAVAVESMVKRNGDWWGFGELMEELKEEVFWDEEEDKEEKGNGSAKGLAAGLRGWGFSPPVVV